MYKMKFIPKTPYSLQRHTVMEVRVWGSFKHPGQT